MSSFPLDFGRDLVSDSFSPDFNFLGAGECDLLLTAFLGGLPGPLFFSDEGGLPGPLFFSAEGGLPGPLFFSDEGGRPGPLFFSAGGLPGPFLFLSLLGGLPGPRFFSTTNTDSGEALSSSGGDSEGCFLGLPRLRGGDIEASGGVLFFGGRPLFRGASAEVGSGSGFFLGRPGPRFTGVGSIVAAAEGTSGIIFATLAFLDFGEPDLSDDRVPSVLTDADGDLLSGVLVALEANFEFNCFSACTQDGQNQL